MHNTNLYYNTLLSIEVFIYVCNLYSIFEINNLLTMKNVYGGYKAGFLI